MTNVFNEKQNNYTLSNVQKIIIITPSTGLQVQHFFNVIIWKQKNLKSLNLYLFIPVTISLKPLHANH